MKITFKNKVYIIHWPKKFDTIIITAAKEYKGYKLINWKQAEADGKLIGLPAQLSLRDISRRFSIIKNKRKNKKIKKQHNEEWIKKIGKVAYRKLINKAIQRRSKLTKYIPSKIKTKYGWNTKKIWDIKHKNILLQLVKKYKKGKRVDWKELIKDRLVCKFPHQDRLRLMRYYGQCLKRKPDKIKRRIDALNYKRSNYSRYLKQLNKYNRVKRKTIKDFLMTKVSLR